MLIWEDTACVQKYYISCGMVSQSLRSQHQRSEDRVVYVTMRLFSPAHCPQTGKAQTSLPVSHRLHQPYNSVGAKIYTLHHTESYFNISSLYLPIFKVQVHVVNDLYIPVTHCVLIPLTISSFSYLYKNEIQTIDREAFKGLVSLEQL